MISEKVKCKSLIKDVGIKSKGDDFAEMDMMILFTSSGVTGKVFQVTVRYECVLRDKKWLVTRFP